ncbi:beta-ketoacyl-[acyl-carrier-protein] synthase family protein [Streptomyces sp. NPDC127068]|uniref:beta-ketoacyl-[acyl-carrier-protein] synthase family protein n=1 Tax=Streptomyces sp. NPDC127068 TaxID=3347127 RepID=UPI00364D9100
MSVSEVHVIGLGLVSGAGIGVDENWRRVVGAEATAARDSALVGCPVDFGCRVPGFEPAKLLGPQRAETTGRFAQLALVAAREALAHARLRPEQTDTARFGVVLGTVAGGTGAMEDGQSWLLRAGPGGVPVRTMTTGLVSSAAGEVAIQFGLRGMALTIATACASGTAAIGTARDLIRSGRLDVALAGGADSPLTPLYSAAFDRLRALSRRTDDPVTASRPFDMERDGFVLGEGAGMLVLESESHARDRAAPGLARIAGYASTTDGYHAVRPDPQGTGARRAMVEALADADLAAREVGHVNAHGTSTRRNDEVEAAAIAAVFGTDVAVSSTKGVIGHTFGAAGAIEAACAVLALRHALVPATANLVVPDPSTDIDLVIGSARSQRLEAVLSNSFGFGGYNASLVFTRL